VQAVSRLVISIVVLVSAKARGFQEANAIGGSVILPVIGLVAAVSYLYRELAARASAPAPDGTGRPWSRR